MARSAETDLYPPVKRWLEGLGYEVKSEIGPADVVACREGSDPVVVELKAGFSLTLLQQAVARQAVTDYVYVAVPRWSGKSGWKAFKGNIGLCRRLGLGVLSVRAADGVVQVHCDPAPFVPRKSASRKARLLSEFSRREGDPNLGGTRGQIVTAWKQDCAKIAAHLAANGPSKGAVIARDTGVTNATRIMYVNHLGWFARVDKGLYDLTPTGRANL
ncbi:DUF2161 domain-containing phosphodiesterase [Maritimibacter sp. DP1N21-5]|uniref:DUF2161 domain-containing phosphodiesterase n=1 Tax=Maritimibacter sp. DP1N21-5 TaxID=2836867 RepID=UPI001C45C29E|nr:DUF2161 family putative PD-(D/E)XK-type phosphodiesterase [Maritimibacter sp. DP1N21-5]MBV7410567.1 hypothetical protein [Maritimibacter sp. DP1N21-5]